MTTSSRRLFLALLAGAAVAPLALRGAKPKVPPPGKCDWERLDIASDGPTCVEAEYTWKEVRIGDSGPQRVLVSPEALRAMERQIAAASKRLADDMTRAIYGA